MTDSKQIQLVKDQAEEKQRQLTERFERALDFVNGERQQLIQLQEYEAGYLERIKDRQQQWNPQNASHYRHFCHQLSQAIQEQSTKLQEAELHLDSMRQELRYQQRRIQVLDDVIEREAVAKTCVENQMLQKEMDEHSGRMYFR